MATVPHPYRSGFRRLAALSEPQFKALLDRLSEVEPTLYPQERRYAIEVEGIEVPVLRELLDAVIGLQLYASDQIDRSQQDAIDSFVDDARTWDASLEEADVQRLTDRLAQILSIRALRISARASDLALANERSLLDSRVITDVRPVFETGRSTDVAASVIIHRLKLDCLDSAGRTDLYVTLDTRDLQTLIDQLQRAQSKDASITAALTSAKILVLKPPARERG